MIQEALFSSSEKRTPSHSAKSHSAQSNAFAHTFQLMGDLGRRRGAAGITFNKHVQPAYTFPPKCTKRHP